MLDCCSILTNTVSHLVCIININFHPAMGRSQVQEGSVAEGRSDRLSETTKKASERICADEKLYFVSTSNVPS